MFAIILALFMASAPADVPAAPTSDDSIHAAFDVLLQRYVDATGVDYRAWHESPEDVESLSAYVAYLESLAPSTMDTDHALAFWINLYNAVTLDLVLQHYPVDSIKDTGGFLRSPWKKDRVTVEGAALSLDEIENGVIRRRFDDARIHFALNCASISCPPLAARAFTGAGLDAQLDRACHRALNDPKWVDIDGRTLRLSKIFDWYRDDFVAASGSLVGFVARYSDDVGSRVGRAGELDLEFLDYDWGLNQSSTRVRSQSRNF